MIQTILITGANGQLGKCLRDISAGFSAQFRFEFTDVAELDITDKQAVLEEARSIGADFIVNAAAYTAVDKAESDVEKAYLLNETAVKNLAEVAATTGAMLIHISTDYVFDGKSAIPYTPEMRPNPVSVYGKSKWAGEVAIHNSGCRAAIIRTAWLYSAYGNNFVKTMLRLGATKDNIGVVNDQMGCPTLAADLAKFIMQVIVNNEVIKQIETYHFANKGKISWYDFACKVMELAQAHNAKSCPVAPIPTSQYPTPARRPNYSVFDLSKAANDFHFNIPDWESSLAQEFPRILHNFQNDIL